MWICDWGGRQLVLAEERGGGERTDDFEGVGDDADGHEFLAIVAAVHHQRVGQALDDGALGLAEPLHGVPSCRVGDVDWRADLNVITVI